MNVSKTIACMVVAMLLVTLAGVAGAQDAVTAAGILKAAGQPMSDEQMEKAAQIKVGADQQVFMMMAELFTPEQTDALKEELGVMEGFGGGPEQPRNLFFVILFENEGCPFTQDQIDELKEMDMEPGPGMFEAMQEVYTEEQSNVMQDMFQM